MLAIDLAAGGVGRSLDHHPTVGGFPGGAEAGQPAVAEAADPAQLTRRSPAQPDVEPLLMRFYPDGHCVKVEAGPVVVDPIFGPQPADQRQRLVEPRRPVASGHAERLLLGAVGDAQAEGGE